MTGIPQNQLERVFARCQFQCGFRLATTEVQVVFIRRQTIGQLIRAILSLSKGRAVDQQVVVAGVFLFRASRCHPHAPQAKDHGDG